jgi:hypothetical protein
VKTFVLVLSILAVLLGGLSLLQGLRLVQVLLATLRRLTAHAAEKGVGLRRASRRS